MSLINATYSTLSIKIGEAYFPITCEQSHSWTESANMLGTTTRENPDGWKTSVPTIQGYSLSFSGIYDVNIDAEIRAGYIFLAEAKRKRETIYWKTDDGFHVEYGHGLITSLSMGANIDEYVSFSGSIRGNSFPSDTDNTVVETQPILFVEEGIIEINVWVPDEMEVVREVLGVNALYMTARPDSFQNYGFPDLSDFSIGINGVFNAPSAGDYGVGNKIVLEIGVPVESGDVITLQYTVGSFVFININGAQMGSLPESFIQNNL